MEVTELGVGFPAISYRYYDLDRKGVPEVALGRQARCYARRGGSR